MLRAHAITKELQAGKLQLSAPSTHVMTKRFSVFLSVPDTLHPAEHGLSCMCDGGYDRLQLPIHTLGRSVTSCSLVLRVSIKICLATMLTTIQNAGSGRLKRDRLAKMYDLS